MTDILARLHARYDGPVPRPPAAPAAPGAWDDELRRCLNAVRAARRAGKDPAGPVAWLTDMRAFLVRQDEKR